MPGANNQRRHLIHESLEHRLCLAELNFVAHSLNPDFRREAYGLEVADLNADGRDDLLLVGRSAFSILSKSTNDPSRWRVRDIASRGEITGVEAVDADGDSDLDVVLQDRYTGALRLLDNQGSNFEFVMTDLKLWGDVFTFGDLDGDQDADAVVAIENCSANDGTCTFAISVHENQGDLGFGPGRLVDIQRGLREFALEDMDNDGALDLLSFSSRCDRFDDRCDNAITWYANQNGTLQMGVDVGRLGGKADDVELRDFDQDGDNDVVILSTTGGISWSEQLDDQLAFDEPHTVRPDGIAVPKKFHPSGGLAVADFDGDGDIDLIDGTRRERWEYGWSENVATDQVFADTLAIKTTVGRPVHAVAGDFDGDGDADVAMLTEDYRYYWLENRVPSRIAGDSDGNGVFNSSDLLLVFQAGEYEDDIVGNSDFAKGDWNGDGEFDSKDLVYVFQVGAYSALALTTRQVFRADRPSNLLADIAQSVRKDDKVSRAHDTKFVEGNLLSGTVEKQ